MIVDMVGKPIRVDDLYAFGVQAGYSAHLRIGRVTEVVDDKGTIRVQWLIGSQYSMPNKPTLIQHPKRGMVMPKDLLDD